MDATQKATVFSNVERTSDHLTKWLYSGVYCGLSFTLLHYVGYAFSSAAAHYLGFDPTFTFDGLSSLRHTTGWGPKSIAFVYLMPAAVGLGVFVLSIFTFFQTSALRTHIRSLLFWLAFNAYLQFYSYFFYGIIGAEWRLSDFYASYASVFDWLYWPKQKTILLLSILSVLFLLVGLLFAPAILALNRSQSLTLFKNGDRVIFTDTILIPFVVGLAVVAMASVPMDVNLLLMRVVTSVPLLLACFFAMKLIPDGNVIIVRGGLREYHWKWPILLAALLVAITRLIFSQPF